MVRPLAWRVPITGQKGPNERCIELPLAVAFMQLGQVSSVLDAGCALNHKIGGDLVTDITHVTLTLSNETQIAHPHRHYAEADFRDLSLFPDRSFDRVACISSLEHVGCDNTRYDGPVEDAPETVRFAAKELWRVTRGAILFTVPFRMEPWRERAWRYFTPGTLEQILVPHAQVVFYRRAEDGLWGGPFDDPAETVFDDEPWRVPQIAAVYACR